MIIIKFYKIRYIRGIIQAIRTQYRTLFPKINLIVLSVMKQFVR